MVSLTKYKKAPYAEVPKEIAYFMQQFQGHTTFEGCTKQGIFTNYPGSIEERYSELQQLNDLGHSIYFTVNETSPSGRKAHDIETIRAIFADDDRPQSAPTRFPIEPSIIVQTSGKEDRYKHQYYWLTETENVEEWEQVLYGIIKVYETDSNVHDLARILRVPGFANHKYDPPQACKLLKCSGKIYDWKEIIVAFPPLPLDEINRAQGKTLMGDFNEQELYDRFKSAELSGYITNSVNSLICHWAHHYSDQAIEKKIEHLFNSLTPEQFDLHAKRYYEVRTQVAKFIKSARKAVRLYRKEDSVKASDNVVGMYSELPRDLIWDWSGLKSNEFPEDSLPSYILQAATEIGRINGIGKEPAVISAMAITSALLNKNVILHEGQNHLSHYCTQGSIIVMETGASKSAIYDLMNKPFFEYEKRVQEEWAKTKNINLQYVKAYEKEMKAKERAFEKKKEPASAELEFYVLGQAAIQDKIDKMQVTEPSLYLNDITEEAILRKLVENNSTIALISDDARKPIDILLGEYKRGKTGEAIYIGGFSGTTVISEREGRETRRVDDPALNVLYMVQPDTAIKLRDADMYVPSGLAARMPMFFYPTDGAEIVRKRLREEPSPEKVGPYYQKLRGICLNRQDNPLHVRLSDAGRAKCKEFDMKFANLLEGKWQGEFAKLNKFVSTALQYSTCMAALDDPEFQHLYQNSQLANQDYTLPLRYMNMGFTYAKILFQQSIMTQSTVNEEGIPRKAKSFINRLKSMYEKGTIYEGFVNQGDFRNSCSMMYREDLPQIVEFLLEKKWLFVTKHLGEKRKLNGGFPNKLVDEGDIVLHLNIKGINKRESMGLDKIEQPTGAAE